MNEKTKLAVLIPCYNESTTIAKVISDFKSALPDAKVYVYNNNSTDNTAALASEAGAIVVNAFQQGKGNVVRKMFVEVDADCYIMVDGDDTYPAEYAPSMAKMVLEEGADMVVGDRLSSTYYTENKRPFHNFGNSLVRGLINFIFRSDIKDIMTGYRAFSYGFVKTYPVVSAGFEIETDMSIHAIDKNLLVKNLEIKYRDRPKGSVSKLNTYSDGIQVLLTILKLCRLYKPLAFFSTISCLLLLLALTFLIPVVADYIQTGMVPRFPSLIVSSITALAALLSYFAGLILETIAHKNRQDFALRLHSIHRN